MITQLEQIEHRSKELETLKLAKQQELERRNKGYVWVTKNKISKQVSIETLANLLNIGWVKL